MKGYLIKVSRKDKNKTKKYWYELRDTFLYFYKKKSDYDIHNPPTGLIFLKGLHFERKSSLNKTNNPLLKYGFEIYHKVNDDKMI
jgi:hypothetical protein